MTEELHPPLKEYTGFIWIGDQPGIRLSVLASDPLEAKALVIEQYGTGHVISMRNVDEAREPR